MDKELAVFLVGLATNAQKRAAYYANPNRILAYSGLSSEAKRALLSGDPVEIARLAATPTGLATDATLTKVMGFKRRRRPARKRPKKRPARKKASKR